MKRSNRLSRVAVTVFAFGMIFSGPCGITGLQFQEFLSSSLIRTVTGTLTSVIEAAIIQSAQEPETAAP